MSDAKRLFIAFPLPLDLRADLVGHQKRWSHLPVRWVVEWELHITLLFLGNTPVAVIPDVIAGMQAVASVAPSPVISLSAIRLGSPGGRKSMVWATGLGGSDVHRALVEELQERGAYDGGMLRFTTHITMGRLRRGVRPESEFDVVNVDLNYSFEGDRMELKESELLPSGARHTILETVEFKSTR